MRISDWSSDVCSSDLEGRPVGWDVLEAALAGRAAMLDATGGEGFRLLTGATTSPTLKRQIAELLQRWPAARWHRFAPADDRALHAATWQAFGRSFDIALLLDQAHATPPPTGHPPRRATH